jgi:hypothetical protein
MKITSEFDLELRPYVFLVLTSNSGPLLSRKGPRSAASGSEVPNTGSCLDQLAGTCHLEYSFAYYRICTALDSWLKCAVGQKIGINRLANCSSRLVAPLFSNLVNLTNTTL